jgi:gliding motility-associated-like protein
MTRLQLLLLTLITYSGAFSQDVWLQNHFSPNSGCSLTANEMVTVLINNNSSVVMPSNTINVTYKVDGGAQTSQMLSSNLFPGASWNFSFAVNANLSACGSHTMKVWVTRAGDANHLNDTLVWTVQNDCPVIPGTVGPPATVCEGDNAGILNLTGFSNGTVSSWQSSDDGGATWSPIANTTISNAYSDITETTSYRAMLEGGSCPDDTSGAATITVQPVPVGGTIAGTDSVCETAATGTLTLSGNSAGVLRWEYSANNGTSWTNIANATTSNNYIGLTQTTIYRALTDGGVCSDVWSDTAMIYVDPVYPPTTLTGSDSLCITNASGVVSASGSFSSVLAWESSTDGGSTWVSIANTTGMQIYSNLTQTTYYRMITDGGFCPDVISDTAVIYVQGLYPQPDLGLSDTLCASSVSGSLAISGNMSDVLSWETSEDLSGPWNTVANSTTSFNYSGQMQDTWYRALLDGNFCPDYYSDTAYIQIDDVPVIGMLGENASLCENDTTGLHLVGSMADSLFWEYSLDGVDWMVIADSDTTDYITPPATNTMQFRVTAINGVCPPEVSNSVLVIMNPLPQVTVSADTTIYLGNSVQLSGSGGITGIWMPGATLSDSTIINPIATPAESGPYTYVYYVIDINGCIGSDSIEVKVLDPIDFVIRNVVTMNEDGYNDAWNISGVEFFPGTSAKIFNQYGKLIYETDDYHNEWKGTFDGKELPDGTYYYVVVKGGTTEEFKGTITLLGK